VGEKGQSVQGPLGQGGKDTAQNLLRMSARRSSIAAEDLAVDHQRTNRLFRRPLRRLDVWFVEKRQDFLAMPHQMFLKLAARISVHRRGRQEVLEGAGCRHAFIEPGSRWENGYVESFHRRMRDELLDGELFLHLDEMKYVVERWRMDYNHCRPHSSLSYMTPAGFTQLCREAGCIRPHTPVPV